MANPNFILLYVNDPTRSALFYEYLLRSSPVEASPTFAMFALESGWMLGLWSKHTVEPAATPVGGSELAFAVANEQAVRELYQDWKEHGLRIVQEPTQMDFGYTFTALDPDGHRLRVFASSEAGK